VDVPWTLPASAGGDVPNGELYRAIREDLTAILRVDPLGVQDRPVPACPAWRVRDVVAHLAGVVDDVLHGNLDGVTTDAWTAAQVDARRGSSLVEILDEWDRTAPAFEATATRLGPALDPRALLDTWTHQQDLRSALGLLPADDPVGRHHTAISLARSCGTAMDAGRVPPFRIVLDGTTCARPSAAAAVHTTAFEWARALVGRRSRAQVVAWRWEGIDPEEVVDRLVVFRWADQDAQG
jgi:uncharacterized protein (TIGR03083 family)